MNWFIARILGSVHRHHAFSRMVPSVLSATFATGKTSIFSPKGTPAHSIFELSALVLAVTASIFFVTAYWILGILLSGIGNIGTALNIGPPRSACVAGV